MYIQQFKFVVPYSTEVTKPGDMGAMEDNKEEIQTYSGNKVINNFGITASGSGTWVNGELTGSITSYDYKALYEVYNLDTSLETDYWFVKYRNDTSRDELKKTFEDSKTVTTNTKLTFIIEGNNYGINTVFITYNVIRIEYEGETKDYVATNPPNAGAVLPDGTDYPGGFKAEDPG